MNQQIEKLAEQCYNLPDTPEALYYRRFDKQKFAELIVRECAQVCQALPPLGPYKAVQVATLQDASTHILEHFGVEV